MSNTPYPAALLVVAACSIGYWVLGMAVVSVGLVGLLPIVAVAWPITVVGVALDVRNGPQKVWNYGSGPWIAAVLLLFPIFGPLYTYARYQQLGR